MWIGDTGADITFVTTNAGEGKTGRKALADLTPAFSSLLHACISCPNDAAFSSHHWWHDGDG